MDVGEAIAVAIFGLCVVATAIGTSDSYKERQQRKQRAQWKRKRARLRRANGVEQVAAEVGSEHGDRYGPSHKNLRRAWAKVINTGGGVDCCERECVMPDRRIRPGDYFELAHDHQAGGAFDYLGPAHRECNRAEAEGRGLTFDDYPAEAPTPEAAPLPKESPPWEGFKYL